MSEHEQQVVAVILGGTIPHKELILKLKVRGYYTVLIDYLSDCPAKSVADIHVQESTLDKEKVLQIAREYNASLVICGCVDQANISACYAMEQLGIKPPYSFETAINITNKGYMKKVMYENDIPTAKYMYVSENDTIDSDKFELRYPVFVKPADSNSSNGVRKAYDSEEMLQYLSDAVEISRNHRAIIEECLVGKEISAYCYISNHKAKLLLTAERISVMDGKDEIVKCYASISPAQISQKATRQAEEIATKLANAFKLDNTPLFFQGIVNGDGIEVIEFAPRIGGGVCFKTIQENTGVDILSLIIDSWEGKPADLSAWQQPSRLLVVNTVYGKDCVFDHVEGEQKILDDKDAVAFYQIRSKGDVIDNKRASSSRVAFFIVNASDETDLLNKVTNIYDKFLVMDTENVNQIRKDMNLTTLWKREEIDETSLI